MSFWTWLENLFGSGGKPAPTPTPPAPVAPPPKPPAPAPVPTPAPPPAPLPKVTRLNCIDLSHYDNPVTWALAVAAGIKVCMSKWTDGLTYNDPTGADDRAASHANGVAYMPYHFFRFADDPIAQANWMVKQTGGVQAGELPHCLDLEWDNSSSAPTQYNDGGEIDENGAQLALTFLEKLEVLTGVIPDVYTAPGFFPGSATPATVAKFARYGLWVAHYDVAAPTIPSPWKSYQFWQYTDKAAVPGTSGGVDASYFNGGPDELAALLKAPAL